MCKKRTNEDHFSSLVLMRTKSSIEDLYGRTGYTGKIQVSVYNQKLQNYKIEQVKCNFSKIDGSFCGGTITLYTVCAMCSDTVHFMQFTGLAICMWFNCSKQHNNAQNHKNTGVIQAIFHKCLYIRACPTWCT